MRVGVLFVVASIVLFVLAAVGVHVHGVALEDAGLACLAASFLA